MSTDAQAGRSRRHPVLWALAILMGAGLGLLVLGIVVLAVARGRPGGFSFGNRVAVVELRGVIQDVNDLLETLDSLRKDAGAVAVVLRIDSPGGAVAPSQEVYDAVWRLRDAKPVIASLGSVAASGGYYIASASHTIVADPGTITGSIGAIMSVPQYEALAQKIGISEEIVKSGRFKDTGHPLRPLTPDERQLLQAMIDDVLTQFIEAVAKGRGMEPARVRQLADGRIFSGAQARKAGLVDELGGLDAATRLAWERAGQTGEPRIDRVAPHHRLRLFQVLGQLLSGEPPMWAGGLFYLYPGPVPQ